MVSSAIADGYTVLEAGDNCLYISNEPIWPYTTDGGANQALTECAKMGLPLAHLGEDEALALQEVTREYILPY